MKAKDLLNLPRCCPWLSGLDETESQRVQRDLQVRSFGAGSLVCRRGEPSAYWVGVFSGLLLVMRDDERSLPGLPAIAPGGWLGDDSLVDGERCAEDVVALRNSHLALLPADTYLWLRERSLGFNQMLLSRLEQRMRQCLQQAQLGRPAGADERVAQTLLGLFDPVLHPAVGQTLRITQEELAEICSLSRQRVNQALQRLAALGLLRLRYGGIELAQLQALRQFIGRAEPAARGVPRALAGAVPADGASPPAAADSPHWA